MQNPKTIKLDHPNAPYRMLGAQVNRFSIVGEAKIKKIASFLIKQSAWFCITPLPDDEWNVDVKPDQAPHLERFIQKL